MSAEASAQVQRWLPVALDGAVRRALAPASVLERLPTPGNRRFATSRNRLFAVAENLIADCRADSAGAGGVIPMLVGAGMTDQQILDEVLTLYIGGTETAANTLGWALLTLARHPEVEQRLHAESDEVLDGRIPNYEDLARLPYTLQVIKETMRLYPQPWLNSRRTTADVTLGDYRIPAGANVFFSPYALHRDPRYYPQPEVFNPDRWAAGRGERIPRHAWLSFGAGVRRCLGDSFSTHEMQVILATHRRCLAAADAARLPTPSGQQVYARPDEAADAAGAPVITAIADAPRRYACAPPRQACPGAVRDDSLGSD